MACGYQFKLLEFKQHGLDYCSCYHQHWHSTDLYDAYPAMRGVRSAESLKHLLPGQSKKFTIEATGQGEDFSIQCDRLVPGQRIEFNADI